MTSSGRVVVRVRGEASSGKVVVPVRVEESSMLSRRMKAKTKECDGRGKTSVTLLVVTSVWDGGNCSWYYPILGIVGSWYLDVGSLHTLFGKTRLFSCRKLFHPPCTQDWVGPCLSML
jgi:hypothetical protein